MNFWQRLLGAASTYWTEAALNRRKKKQGEHTPAGLGETALKYARLEVGNGESGGNNRGPDVVRYRNGRDTKGAWCASFAGFCFELAAIELYGSKESLPFKRSDGAGRLAINAAKAGRVVGKNELPQPGDLVLFERGADGDWRKHIGIVESVNAAKRTYVSIEGNVGRFPAKVKPVEHRFGRDRWLRFVRV